MVDIVIVNWNSGGFLKKCVDSILIGATELIGKIIIIDNNSNDLSLATVPTHNKVLVIQNSENLGFARACNQGFKTSTAPYVLLLNPDTRIEENTINNCLDFLKTNTEIDILGCQLLNEDGTVSVSCARFPTPFGLLIDATGLSKIAPGLFPPSILMTDWNHLQSRYVDQVMGAFMFMHKDIFKKLGYFDERFFVYYEELDFSLRLAKAGGKTFYNSNIKVVHTGMGTTEAVKAYRLFLNLRSRLKYAKKNFSRLGYWVVFLSTFTIEFVSRLFFLAISGRFKEIKDLIKGYQLLVENKSPMAITPGVQGKIL
ncbi:MAG: glycosyltransferase family 2 protein [Ferruginibacter sp.]